MLQAAARRPGSLVVGSRDLAANGMPVRNTMANRFSNFWFRLQTGIRLPDTQTGFRLYPLCRMGSLWWLTARYEAELELLVWAAWRGIPLVPVPVRVWYPPEEERVSHSGPCGICPHQPAEHGVVRVGRGVWLAGPFVQTFIREEAMTQWFLKII